jgi:hypothetical protein
MTNNGRNIFLKANQEFLNKSSSREEKSKDSKGK